MKSERGVGIANLMGGLSCSLALNGSTDFFSQVLLAPKKSPSPSAFFRYLGLFGVWQKRGFATRRPAENPLEPRQSFALWFASQ